MIAPVDTAAPIASAAPTASAAPVASSPFPPPVALAGITKARDITGYHAYFAVTTIEKGLLQSRQREKLDAPVPIDPSWQGVERVAAGERATCAIARGEVRCWGARKDGMLGRPDASSTQVPVAVPGITNATDIAAGDDYACVLVAGGKVLCWGELIEGKPIVLPTAIALPATRQVVIGEESACVLLVSGEVRCWGTVEQAKRTDATVPVAITLPGNATAVAAGERHFCALLEAGAVWCWGSNHAGQSTSAGAGAGDVDPSLAFDAPVVELSAGGAATCVRRPDAKVHCRGDLGSGFEPPIELREPAHVPAFDGAESIQVLPNLVCAGSSRGLVCLNGPGR